MQIILSILCLLTSYLFLTEKIFLHNELILPLYILRITLLVLSAGFILNSLQQSFKSDPVRSTKTGVLVFLFFLVSLFNLMEIVFMFIPKSQGPNMAYSSRVWFWYYWKTNKDGFREVDLYHLDTSRQKIVFIGDSYTAGQGIKNNKDRVSNLLQSNIPSDFQCINLGKNGSNTPDEIRLMKNLPIRPDITIIGHVLNDVDYLMQTSNKYVIQQFAPQNRSEVILEYLGKKSFVFNFLYWHYKAHQNYLHVKKEYEIKLQASRGSRTSNTFLKEIYEPFYNDSLLSIHVHNLEILYNMAAKNNKKCIVLLYPDLFDMALTTNGIAVNNILRQALGKKGIACLDLSPLASRLPEKDRMANNMDAHPGVRINKLFADSLLLYLEGLAWIP